MTKRISSDQAVGELNIIHEILSRLYIDLGPSDLPEQKIARGKIGYSIDFICEAIDVLKTEGKQ